MCLTQKVRVILLLKMQSQESVIIRAESGWHDSQSDAEIECDERLDLLEAEAIANAESKGGSYSTGTTSGYSIDYNSATAEYRCSRERVLEFSFSGDEKGMFPEIPYEEYVAALSRSEAEPPIDITGELTKRLFPLAPKFVEEKIVLPRPIRTNFTVRLPLKDIVFRKLSVVDSRLQLDDLAQVVNIPLKETVLHIPFRNCGGLPHTINRQFSYKVVRGWKISFAKKVTSSIKIGGKLTFKGGSFGAEADVAHRLSTEISETKDISETTDETVQTEVPPKEWTGAEVIVVG